MVKLGISMVRVAVLAAAMLVTLSGCDILSLAGIGGNESANAASNQAAGPKDPPGSPSQVADAGVTTSRSLQPVSAELNQAGEKDPAAPASTFSADMLVGRWGDNGDCMKGVEFFANGTFEAYNGGSGSWQLSGDALTIAGRTLRLQSVNANTLIVINPDGSVGTSQRC